jgi:hypothetical protein
LLLLAACWTSETKPVEQPTTTPTPAADEREAIVRIDAEPGGKKFQGVWLDFGTDRRWVIAYRAHGLWKPFENREVIVTGQCYQPFGQAIGATHFRVDGMRFVKPERGRGPILALGPEQRLRGTFTEYTFAPGSKRAGSPERSFTEDAGKQYLIAGASDDLPALGTAARIWARDVVPDLSWTAQADGPNLWILDVRDPDSVEDPAHAPAIVPCP